MNLFPQKYFRILFLAITVIATATFVPAQSPITIDTTIASVMDYFEIFLSRMIMCRRAAEFLGCRFGLEINQSMLI